jgi:hypothetical protein
MKTSLSRCPAYAASPAFAIPVQERSDRAETEINVALGGYVSDLEVGDRIGPLDYVMSRFVIREYGHANELHHEFFQGIDGQIAPPTLVHLDKLRLYRHACPKGVGPSARIHYEFDATMHAPIPAGERLSVSGEITERYTRRGRDYVVTEIELRRASDGALLVTYRDTTVLSYRKTEES